MSVLVEFNCELNSNMAFSYNKKLFEKTLIQIVHQTAIQIPVFNPSFIYFISTGQDFINNLRTFNIVLLDDILWR